MVAGTHRFAANSIETERADFDVVTTQRLVVLNNTFRNTRRFGLGHVRAAASRTKQTDAALAPQLCSSWRVR